MQSQIDVLTEVYRQFKDVQQTRISCELRAMAICRRACDGEKTEGAKLYRAARGKGEHPLADLMAMRLHPIIESILLLEAHEKAHRKNVERAAAEIPQVVEWSEAHRGVGLLNLGSIVAEAGDLRRFPNPAKLWTFFGYGLFGGKIQKALTGDDAKEHGFSRRRHSLGWQLADGIVKSRDPKYRALYDERKALELARLEAGELKSKGHAENRARRYVSKRMLRDFWVFWREAAAESR